MVEPTGARTVPGVVTDGGVHCESSALRVLLAHAGIELSEPMVFGLGAGLSFVYWDSRRQPLPFLGGRVKPFALTRNLAQRLGLRLDVHETSSPSRAWETVRGAIDRGVPVGLQLDSHHLEYFGSRVHFAGHIVAMHGYDDDGVHLVDTAQQGGAVRTSRASLARARAARGPMAARHRSFTLEAAGAAHDGALTDPIAGALAECAEAFLHPPIANLGGRGIATAARRVPGWLDRVSDPARDLAAIATMMERAGTGGGLFRALYRDFLDEAAGLLHSEAAVDAATPEAVERARDLFADAALIWTDIAGRIAAAGAAGDPEALREAGRLLERAAVVETEAMTVLAHCRV